MPPPAKNRFSHVQQLVLGTLLLVILTALAYAPALHAGFIWDDDNFLTQNPSIKAADGLRRFWLTTQSSDYWPLTSTTMWVEWRIWGMNAAGYHVTNVVLHIAESLLLWAVLKRLGIPGAFLGALFFALHPVNVESVAWITQRKNLVAMLFFLLSVFCFLKDGPGRSARTNAASGPEALVRAEPAGLRARYAGQGIGGAASAGAPGDHPVAPPPRGR